MNPRVKKQFPIHWPLCWFNGLVGFNLPSKFVQCEAPKIAKLVQITPITMVYGTYNYSYWGESKPTNNPGGGHIVRFVDQFQLFFWDGQANHEITGTIRNSLGSACHRE